MTIKNLYPKSRPQIIYNVVNGRPELPAASAFSRASEATYVDSTGIIQTAAIDEPRFNYDPDTGEFLGLLLEEERENIVSYSDFGDASWSGSSITKLSTTELAPDGSNTATMIVNSDPNGSPTNTYLQFSQQPPSGYVVWSFYAKGTAVGQSAFIDYYDGGSVRARGTVSLDDGTVNYSTQSGNATISSIDAGNGWWRCLLTIDPAGDSLYFWRVGNYANGNIIIWGAQVEKGKVVSSFIESSGSPTTRELDAFSLTSSNNFDGGFSLLLDSETSTEDFIYKIKASGTTIAELNNANGTLDWDINGQSAATNGEYPQVGAIQPGRVRTVSSFGAADGTTKVNYLYTTGLSFPTNAIVAPGADEVEFGPGQTLKAAYLWNGQLSNTEAVSVIKGEYNVVPNEPIQADSYSFVYNTDVTDIGETTIDLPYIVPTKSMRIFWGDGTNDRLEKAANGTLPLPQHTYPYPGQYRIQIDAEPDGFEATRLSDISNTITRVDAWPPNKRVDATGDGFTGNELNEMLSAQAKCELIPPFKYTDLTNLDKTFYNCQAAAVNNWDWVPTNLQLVTRLSSAFRSVCRITMTTTERGTFPQLQTGPALTNIVECFRFNNLSQFDQGNSGLPFSNTQNVTNWTGCFRDLDKLTEIGPLDTSAATNLSNIFSGCGLLAQMPFITTNNVTTFQNAWSGCEALTSFPQIDTSSGTDFTNAWLDCTSLTSFPSLNFSSATSLEATFSGTGLITFPAVTMPTVPFTANSMFEGCSNLTGGPNLDFSNCTKARAAFRNCNILSAMVPIDAPNNTDLYQTYRGNNFTTVVAMDTSNVSVFYGTFQYCDQLVDVSEIANWDLSSGINFYQMFNLCPIVDFPANVFDTTGTLNSNAFFGAWKSCALSAQSIENILVSLDANGQSNIELSIDGGTNAAKSTWTATAVTAYDNLIAKGWTISFNA